MKNIEHLTPEEELKKLMFKPMSNEEVIRLRMVRRKDKWLLELTSSSKKMKR